MSQSSNTEANKRIAKNTLLLYLRSIFLLCITFYTSRVVLQVLGVEDFGIYNIVGGVVSMFSLISGTLATSTQRFITFSLGEGDLQKTRKVFCNSITLHIILGFVIVLILEIAGLWFLGNKLNIPDVRMEAAHIVFQCSIFTFFVNLVSVPYNALIIAYERMSAYAYISIVDGILKLAIALSLIYYGSDKLVLFGLLHAGSAIVIRFIYSIYSSKHFEVARHIKIGIDRNLFKSMFSFAGWNIFGQTSLVCRNQGIDILLNLFFDVTVNSAKGICSQVQQGVYQLVSNFQTSVKPQITKSIAQEDFDRVYTLTIQGSRFSFYLMTILALPVIVSCEELLSLWLPVVPDYAVVFVQWTMLYLLLDTQSRFLMHNIMSTGNIRNYQLVIGISKILTLPIAYIALLLGGSPLTGIIVNILIEIVCLVERLYFNRKQIDFPVDRFLTSAITTCFGVFFIALVPCLLLRYYVTSSLPLNLLFTLVVTTFIILFQGLNNQERSTIFSYMMKIARKIHK